MTQYNSLRVKLPNSQHNKLKSAIKNETEVVLRLSSNMIGDNQTHFPQKLLLTNRKVANLRKAFTNYLLNDIKLSKSQLSVKRSNFTLAFLRLLAMLIWSSKKTSRVYFIYFGTHISKVLKYIC